MRVFAGRPESSCVFVVFRFSKCFVSALLSSFPLAKIMRKRKRQKENHNWRHWDYPVGMCVCLRVRVARVLFTRCLTWPGLTLSSDRIRTIQFSLLNNAGPLTGDCVFADVSLDKIKCTSEFMIVRASLPQEVRANQ